MTPLLAVILFAAVLLHAFTNRRPAYSTERGQGVVLLLVILIVIVIVVFGGSALIGSANCNTPGQCW